MPTLQGKGKGKARESRRSPSRNTTPSSGISASTVLSVPTQSYLDSDISKLLVPTTIQYTEIIDRLGGGAIPEPKSLQALAENLKTLSQLADARGDACNLAMRELSQKRKDASDEHRIQERADRISEERSKMKREAEDDDEDVRAVKGGKVKKRKDRGSVKEERPLTHGAHGVVKQDGSTSKAEGTLYFYYC
jgi:transcriptional adapter 3